MQVRIFNQYSERSEIDLQAPTSVPNQMTTKTTTITTSQTTAPVPIPMPVEPVLPPLPNVPPTESRPIDNGASLAMTSGQSDVPSMLEPAPPAPFKPVHPPGQTVGDLLNSILGVASPPLPAGPPPMIPPHSSMSRNDDRRSPLPNPDRPAPPTSAGTPRSPFPPVISPNVPPQLAPHPAANFLPPLPGSSPAVPNTSHIVSPPHHQASPVPPISYPSQPLDPRLAVAASLVDTVPSKDYTSHAQGPVDPKFAFVRDLIELLHVRTERGTCAIDLTFRQMGILWMSYGGRIKLDLVEEDKDDAVQSFVVSTGGWSLFKLACCAMILAKYVTSVGPAKTRLAAPKRDGCFRNDPSPLASQLILYYLFQAL